MEKVIRSFKGDNHFLSNFYNAPVMYDGITYRNSEAAFQAQKCKSRKERFAFAELDPSAAKRKGRHVKLRGDWEQVKRNVMYGILTAKFTQNPVLGVKLRATGNCHLEEGNTWGDRTWGTVNGVGENWLGKLLMQVRMDISKDNELIILERGNGMYGGYMIRDCFLEQVFNTHSCSLFITLKPYVDKGCALTLIGTEYEKEFMKGRTATI